MSPPQIGIVAILSALLALSAACGGGGSGQSITVFAAASLAEAFDEIAQEFELKNPGVSVKLNLAGSQRLRSQLELGAKADVFASANNAQMDLAVAADLIAGTPAAFATSSLAVITSGDADGGPVQTLEDLAEPGVSVVLAHPSVPAGAYARQLLENLSADDSRFGGDFGLRVLENVVSEETNVRNVEQKVVLGEVDAGIVYRPGAEQAAALAALDHGGIKLVPVPAEYNVHATYPIAVLQEAERPDVAASFVAFVLAPQGQAILSRHGFGPRDG